MPATIEWLLVVASLTLLTALVFTLLQRASRRRSPPVALQSTPDKSRRMFVEVYPPPWRKFAMFTCTICSFETCLDDVVARIGRERCICLRCFARETGNELPMPRALQRQVIASLEEIRTV